MFSVKFCLPIQENRLRSSCFVLVDWMQSMDFLKLRMKDRRYRSVFRKYAFIYYSMDMTELQMFLCNWQPIYIAENR